MKTKKALLFAVVFCLFYSVQIVLQQLFVRTAIYPLHLDFLTNLSAFILMTLYFAVFRRDLFRIKLRKKSLLIFLVATFLWIAADLSSIFGLKNSSSINLSIISRLQIIITYFLAAFFFAETVSVNKIVASILSFVGGLVVVYNFKAGYQVNPGDILFLVFAFTISFSGLLRQHVSGHIPAIQMTYLMYGISSLVLGLLTFIFAPIKTIAVPGFIVFNSVIAVLGFICVNTSISIGGATFFSIVSSLLPVFTAVLAFVFLKQLPLVSQIVGAVIITLGIVLFQKNENH